MAVTRTIVIAIAPRCELSYSGTVQPDGLSICIYMYVEKCASDDKRDESHLEFASSKEYSEVTTSSCIENSRRISVNIRLEANRD